MKIAISSDHAGFELKQGAIDHLVSCGHDVVDCGPASDDSVDYPDMALPVCRKVQSTECDVGILICGTGIGMSIVANKMTGIRAALCRDEFSAVASRSHNDANVLVLGSRVTGSELALAIIDAWLAAEFSGGRHARRVGLIEQLEQEG